jgi:Nickel responsive protein SCO4226-like
VQTLANYTVELRLPRTGWLELQEATARARRTSEEMRREGVHVRFLRSVFVPEDDACFFLYEGSSAHAVRTAATRASLGVLHIAAAIQLANEGQEAS